MRIAAGVAGVVGASVGGILLFAPHRMLEPTGKLRRWLLEVDLGEVFNRRYVIERRVYRRHRIVGAAVLIGAAASLLLLVFLTSDPRSIPLRLALGRFGFRAVSGLVGAVFLTLFLVGLSLAIRPSVLKGIEAAANRWIEPKLGGWHIDLSRLILRAPRVSGALLLLAGIACLWPV